MHSKEVEKLHKESVCSSRSWNPTATNSNRIFTNFRKKNQKYTTSHFCNIQPHNH